MKKICGLIKFVLMVLCLVFTLSVAVSSTSYAYTDEEKQAVKEWLAANGYPPTMAGLEQAYADYLAGKIEMPGQNEDDPPAEEPEKPEMSEPQPAEEEKPADETEKAEETPKEEQKKSEKDQPAKEEIIAEQNAAEWPAEKTETALKVEETRKAEEEKKAEETRKAEEEKKAEETRKAEEEKKAEETRKAEEEKKAEEIRKAEEEKKAEEFRKAEEIREEEEPTTDTEVLNAEEEIKIQAEKNRKANIVMLIIAFAIITAGVGGTVFVLSRKKVA